ncbi:MAG: winged helix DNA-binding domain-containing protein [Marivirga sp.]|nr:winged helix DNA-binding domain-containing protein [Marivirga sp.]
MKKATEISIEKAIIEKKIVRTWPMRGTLHFVTAEDVRWMLKLLTPRVIARCALLYKQSELDSKVFNKSKKALIKALQSGKILTRPEMYQILEQSRISTKEQRGLHILAYLAQEGLLCFGPRNGKQQTFTLLDEWLPAHKVLDRDESLAELAKRYFSSHGPATLQDYTWWSGLSPADAKKSLALVQSQFENETIDAKTYWLPKDFVFQKQSIDTFLLPAFDEYTVAYKDRAAFLDPDLAKQAKNGIFSPVLIQHGKIAGIWKRTLKKDSVEAEITCFGKNGRLKTNEIKKALIRYGEFLETPVKMLIG